MRVFSSLALVGVMIFMVACNTVDDSTTTAPDDSKNGTISAVASTYLVEWSGDQAKASKTIKDAGGVVVDVLPEINVALVSQLTAAEVTALSAKTNIETVTPNQRLKYVPSIQDVTKGSPQAAGSHAQANPADAGFYQSGWQWNMTAINAPAAWAVTQGDGIRVGILDTGGSPDHVDLDGKYDLAACRNFVPSDPYTPGSPVDPNDWQDRHFHGTHVAGIIATNSIALAAVAPEATLVAVKVLTDEGWGDDFWILEAILYASDPNGGNCDVINMSLGGEASRALYDEFIGLYNKTVNKANSRGCLVVCAAGNSAIDLDHAGDLITLPVEAGTAMGVSATGPLGQADFDMITCYSNYGSSVIDVAAPGGNFDCNAGLVDVLDLVISCLSPWVAENIYGLPDPNQWYVWAAGTSMACPHVAGTAAQVMSASGNHNPGWVKNKIRNSADDLGKKGNDPLYGHGRINVGQAVD